MKTLDVTVMVMQSGKKEIPSFTVKIPDNYTIQDLLNFLDQEKKVPFENFFLTNKPAQRWQFSNQKTLKEIRSQCQQYNGTMLLLCYQTSIKPVHQTSSHVQQIGRGNKKNETDGCCYLI